MEPTWKMSDALLNRAASKDGVLLTHEVRDVCKELIEARKQIRKLMEERDALETKLESAPQNKDIHSMALRGIAGDIGDLRQETRYLDSALDDRTGRLMALEAWAASIGFKGAQQ